MSWHAISRRDGRTVSVAPTRDNKQNNTAPLAMNDNCKRRSTHLPRKHRLLDVHRMLGPTHRHAPWHRQRPLPDIQIHKQRQRPTPHRIIRQYLADRRLAGIRGPHQHHPRRPVQRCPIRRIFRVHRIRLADIPLPLQHIMDIDVLHHRRLFPNVHDLWRSLPWTRTTRVPSTK